MRKLLLVVAAALACAGCSSFDKDFVAARTLEPGASYLEGAWDGSWESSKGQGSGKLQAIISRDTTHLTSMQRSLAAGTYDAKFKAWWGGVFTSEYALPLEAKTDITKVQTLTVHAEHDLGVGAGQYVMDGEGTATSITARYKSSVDEGTIELHRPRTSEK